MGWLIWCIVALVSEAVTFEVWAVGTLCFLIGSITRG